MAAILNVVPEDFSSSGDDATTPGYGTCGRGVIVVVRTKFPGNSG